MPHPDEERAHQEPFNSPPRRVELDDRIAGLYGLCTPDLAADRLEAQELRQLVHQALQQLSADEMRVIELRYQRKHSPGQAASRLGLSPQHLAELETNGLQKIRAFLLGWNEEP